MEKSKLLTEIYMEKNFVSHNILSSGNISPVLCLLYQEVSNILKDGINTLFIQGEKGTGKEFFAKMIHFSKNGFGSPFYSINCEDITHCQHFEEKYTRYVDLITSDSSGTIFIKNINFLDYDQQQRLLKSFHKEILLISTSQHSLRTLTKQKKIVPDIEIIFKQCSVCLPPLRERKEDVEFLSYQFVEYFNKEYGKNIKKILPEAMDVLKNHSWPNNVRELKNVIEYAVLLSKGKYISCEEIRFNVSKKFIAIEALFNQGELLTLDELERLYISTVLKRVKNNKSKAASLLGISRNTLRKKMLSFPPITSKKKSSSQAKLPF